jgi:hypothetical protein
MSNYLCPTAYERAQLRLKGNSDESVAGQDDSTRGPLPDDKAAHEESSGTEGAVGSTHADEKGGEPDSPRPPEIFSPLCQSLTSLAVELRALGQTAPSTSAADKDDLSSEAVDLAPSRSVGVTAETSPAAATSGGGGGDQLMGSLQSLSSYIGVQSFHASTTPATAPGVSYSFGRSGAASEMVAQCKSEIRGLKGLLLNRSVTPFYFQHLGAPLGSLASNSRNFAMLDKQLAWKPPTAVPPPPTVADGGR